VPLTPLGRTVIICILQSRKLRLQEVTQHPQGHGQDEAEGGLSLSVSSSRACTLHLMSHYISRVPPVTGAQRFRPSVSCVRYWLSCLGSWGRTWKAESNHLLTTVHFTITANSDPCLWDLCSSQTLPVLLHSLRPEILMSSLSCPQRQLATQDPSPKQKPLLSTL
jgi:hypothetical protein